MSLSIFMSLFSLLSVLSTSSQSNLQKTNNSNGPVTEWVLSDVLKSSDKIIRVAGKPQTIKCKYGEALLFNGKTDGLFLNQMPVAGLEEFTIEAIVRFDGGGKTEQRFFHSGEINGDRILMELRASATDWYFDAFIGSGTQKKTLVDSTLLHPLNQWYHVAFVIDHGALSTYVNGKKELEGHIDLVPLKGGITSIGVRQNELSWFNGAIYKIKISPKALIPNDFMGF
jgi:hypothetical protein